MAEQDFMTDEAMYDKALLDSLLLNNEIDAFRDEFLELHTYDQGAYFTEADDELRNQMYHLLSPKEVAEFLETTEMEDEDYDHIFDTMDARYASDMLSEMSIDNAVDLLKILPKTKVASLLLLMDKDASEEIKALLHYEENTAGSLMTTEYISISEMMSVREAMVHVKEQAPEAETNADYYIVVGDEEYEFTLKDGTSADFLTPIQALHDTLNQNGKPHYYKELSGSHNWKTWKPEIENMLNYYFL